MEDHNDTTDNLSPPNNIPPETGDFTQTTNIQTTPQSKRNKKPIVLIFFLIITVAILVLPFFHHSNSSILNSNHTIKLLNSTTSKITNSTGSPLTNVYVDIKNISLSLNYSNRSQEQSSVPGLSINYYFRNLPKSIDNPPFLMDGRLPFNVTFTFKFFPTTSFRGLVTVLNISSLPDIFKIIKSYPVFGVYIPANSTTNITVTVLSPAQNYTGPLNFTFQAANT